MMDSSNTECGLSSSQEVSGGNVFAEDPKKSNMSSAQPVQKIIIIRDEMIPRQTLCIDDLPTFHEPHLSSYELVDLVP
jgi:hypothetical protein